MKRKHTNSIKATNCQNKVYNLWQKILNPFRNLLKNIKNTNCCKKYGRADMYNEIDSADE